MMREFNYEKLTDRTWDGETLSYVAENIVQFFLFHVIL